MEETLLFPSPNWFQTSGFIVTPDGWLIYGGPSKSLCLLQPLSRVNEGILQINQRFQAHVVNRAHIEKIVSVDVSPLWPKKMSILTGSADGSVKHWSVEKTNKTVSVKLMLSHDIHCIEKEEVVSVGYSDNVFVITVGTFGNMVKWNLNSNVVKVYNNFFKTFKPTCMACSRHILLNVAVGTKQGVVFVLDLKSQGRLLYKVRAQDEELVNLSWCPQYEVLVKKTLKQSDKRPSTSNRMEQIRNAEKDKDMIEEKNVSGVVKSLPEDSFDESIVKEDDMFDIYKDHEADEFGHKKYVPEDIVIKMKEKNVPDDFLAECTKLKEDILKKKNEPEPTIASLVEAFEQTHVENENPNDSTNKTEKTKQNIEASAHSQKHLLATVGKHGGVRIWSKSGKLLASCSVSHPNKNIKNKGPLCVALLWYKADVLLIADGKGQLLECNPLKIDCKNKLEWQVIHSSHKRGLYAIASNAPRVQTAAQLKEDTMKQWVVWTAAQDRNIICYSMEEKKEIVTYNTCGGFVYNIQSCPYDSRKVAIGVGDGAVRVWEAGAAEDGSKVGSGKVYTYWQNVQGKVLTVAWHPTRENVLAFSTAESRVGIIDTSGKTEKPARTLVPVLRGGVYSLCWGEGNELYACGGGEMVVYRTDSPDQDPVPVNVEFEGKRWELGWAVWSPHMLVCGSNAGAVGVLEPDTRQLVAAAFVFTKMIHSARIHPEQTSGSNEASPCRNLIAVASLDKQCNVVVLEYKKDEQNRSLQVWKTLMGHKAPVLQLAWSPHHDGRLASTSQDGTVRVWDVLACGGGACVGVFGAHRPSALSVAWRAEPGRGHELISGGVDCSLRLWDVRDHRPDDYTEIKHDTAIKKEKKKGKDKKENDKKEIEVVEPKKVDGEENQVAAALTKYKLSKKFLLPIINKQITICPIQSIKKLVNKLLENQKNDTVETATEVKEDEETVDADFIKIFGDTNDLNEMLDKEMESHLQYKRYEAWTMLAIFRGRMTDMIDFNVKRDSLCPFLVSLTPSVSPKYWKDVVLLYMAQIERIAAKEESDKIIERCGYGGSVYRRAALMLGVHDARGAVALLTEMRLFKEAYVLARARHMDALAESTLQQWAADGERTGNTPAAVVCNLALRDPYKAALLLATTNDREQLVWAAELATAAGQPTLAAHIADKLSQAQPDAPAAPDAHDAPHSDELPPLPTKMELLKIKEK